MVTKKAYKLVLLFMISACIVLSIYENHLKCKHFKNVVINLYTREMHNNYKAMNLSSKSSDGNRTLEEQNSPYFNNWSTATSLHSIPACPAKTFGTRFPPTALMSFPGSGNTWMRHLIETATGFFTGSVFRDEDLYQNGFKGEGLRVYHWNRLISIKIHNIFPCIQCKLFSDIIKNANESKCVILMRNPYDAFISEFTRFHSNATKHTGMPNMTDDQFKSQFQDDKLTKHYYEQDIWYKAYFDFYEKCLFNSDIPGRKKSVYVVFYENLRSDVLNEMKALMIYLEEFDLKRLNKCLGESPTSTEGKFHRKKHFSKEVFTDEMKRKIDSMIIKLNETMKVLPLSYLSK